MSLASLFGTHTGAWGTPELGITEAIQGFFAPKKAYAASGGSNLFGPTPAAAPSGGGQVLSSVAPPASYNPTSYPSGGGGSAPAPAPAPGGGSYDPAAEAERLKAEAAGQTESYESRVRGEIEKAYEPIFSELDRQIGMLPQQRAEFATQIESLATTQVGSAKAEEAAGVGRLEEAKAGEESAAAGSIRDLEQDVRDQMKAWSLYFGGRGAGFSSAPGVASEAVTRGGLKGKATILAARNEGLNQIKMKQEDVHNLATQQLGKIEEWKGTKLFEITQWATERLNTLSSEKAQAGAQKGQAIVNLIQNTQQQFMSRLQQLDDAVMNYKTAVSTWQQQRAGELEDYAAKLKMSATYTSGTGATYTKALGDFNKLYQMTGDFAGSRDSIKAQYGVDPTAGYQLTPEQESQMKKKWETPLSLGTLFDIGSNQNAEPTVTPQITP